MAETAYSWVDPSGQIFYGTKPPANAKSIQKVQPKNYSRYSGSKLMRGVTGSNYTRGALKRSPVTETNITVQPEQTTLDSKQNDAKVNSKKGNLADLEQAIRLESSRPAVQTNSKSELTGCRVNVTNKSLIDVGGIQVAFEFADGTLVTTEGPSRLNAKQIGTYSIPSENLPLALAPGTKIEPKILVNSDADFITSE